MADVYTTQTSLGTLAQNVWAKALIWPYRDENVFDAVATARSTTENGMRGKGVTHTYVNDLPLATTPIDELIGPDAITFTTSTRTFGLEEYAQTMKTSFLARTTSYIDLDAAIANLIGQNAGASMDTIAATELVNTTNIQRANGRATNGAITATDTMTATELEKAYTAFSVLNIPKINGSYWAFMHPYQIHDLRIQVGPGSWRESFEHGSASNQPLIDRAAGKWAGFTIVPSNREPQVANIGAGGTVDVFKSILVGADALAKSYSDHPEAPGATPGIVFGLPTDALKRNYPVSWHHLVSYDQLRTNSVLNIYSASSLANNAS